MNITGTTLTKYRCSKGHEWTSSIWENNSSLNVYLGAIRDGPYCIRCIIDWLEANVGKVHEVPDADVPVCVEGKP